MVMKVNLMAMVAIDTLKVVMMLKMVKIMIVIMRIKTRVLVRMLMIGSDCRSRQ